MQQLTPPRLRALFLVHLALALVGGCAGLFDESGMLSAPPPTNCSTDAECAQNGLDEVCRRADGTGTPIAPDRDGGGASHDGICVIAGNNSAEKVFLEIRPASGLALPPTQHGPIALAAGQNQVIVLAQPASVSGEVLYHDVRPAQKIPRAKVRFRTPKPLIPGRPLTFESETQAEESDSPGQFAQTLPRGTYAITVFPPDHAEGVRAPPERPLDETAAEELFGGHQFSLEVSNASELITFSGRAVFERTGASATVPAAGIELWALDGRAVERGRGAPPRLLSQAVRTDAEGRFTLWLPRAPSTGPHMVRLQFGSAADGVSLPVFPPTRIFELATSTALGEDILIGRIPAALPLSGTVADARGAPVANARVTFRTVELSPFTFSASATTDALGRYSLSVYPASYAAIAMPPVDPSFVGILPLAPCTFGGPFVPNPEQTVAFVCERRRSFFGQVAAKVSGGVATAPLAGVTVEAVRRPDESIRDELRDQVVSDSTGQFALTLAPGVYDLSLRPPADSKQPFKSVRGVHVDPATLPRLVVFELETPFELYGQLFSGDESTPVAASIEAYTVGEDGSTVLVGRGLSQRDGSYSLVLPAGR